MSAWGYRSHEERAGKPHWLRSLTRVHLEPGDALLMEVDHDAIDRKRLFESVKELEEHLGCRVFVHTPDFKFRAVTVD